MDFYGMYENSYNQDILRVELDKEFLTYKTKWAGGAAYSRVYSSKTLIDGILTSPWNCLITGCGTSGEELLFICRKSIVITGYFT